MLYSITFNFYYRNKATYITFNNIYNIIYNHFKKLILIKTTKNILIFINNNTFTYSLTSNIEPSGIEPSGIEPSIARYGNNGNRSSNDKGKSATYIYDNNPPNLTVNINFLNYHFNNNG